MPFIKRNACCKAENVLDDIKQFLQFKHFNANIAFCAMRKFEITEFKTFSLKVHEDDRLVDQ